MDYIRDEIEEIIKKKNIDRTHFHEFSKFRYEDIIRKFYYKFHDYKNFLMYLLKQTTVLQIAI